MQPLLITSLVALLIALLKLRSTSAELIDLQYWNNYHQDDSRSWRESCFAWRKKYDAQLAFVNKLQVDNALLKAELREKHRRVPKL